MRFELVYRIRETYTSPHVNKRGFRVRTHNYVDWVEADSIEKAIESEWARDFAKKKEWMSACIYFDKESWVWKSEDCKYTHEVIDIREKTKKSAA